MTKDILDPSLLGGVVSTPLKPFGKLASSVTPAALATKSGEIGASTHHQQTIEVSYSANGLSSLEYEYLNGAEYSIFSAKIERFIDWQANLASKASSGPDVLRGSNEADRLKGLKGADTLIGGRGDDKLFGAQGKDDLRGGAGEDRLFGGSGADRLTGGAGADKLAGGAGADLLRGGAGADRLFGGNGADRIFADGADQSVKGGNGADRISLDLSVANAQTTRIDGEKGKDKIVLHIDYDVLNAEQISAFADDIDRFENFLKEGAPGVFRFQSFALNIRNVEQLILREKGDRPPVSRDDAGRVSENDTVTIDLLANDDQALRISKLNGAKVEIGETIITEFGAIKVVSTSVITFTPTRAAQALSDGETLNSTFTYRAIDEDGLEGAEALVAIEIDGVSDPLITLPASIGGTPLSGVQGEEIVLSGVEVNLPGDEDAILRVSLEFEGGVVGFTNETDITALTIVDGDGLDGSFGFEGTAAAIAKALANSLSLRVLDPNVATSLLIKASSATTGEKVDQVAIAIDPQVNTVLKPPSAIDDTFEVRAEGRIEGNLFSNDRANEGGVLKLFNATTPSDGALIVADSGAFSYRPNAGFSGEDMFQYAVLEDGRLSNIATATITVLANQAPVANMDDAMTAEDTPITIDVLFNDTDPENDPLSLKEASALFGTVEITAEGTLTYAPPDNFSGVDRISYVLSDGGLTDVGDVRVQVSAVNDAPFAVGDAVAVDEDTVIVFDVLANDLDADGDPLQIVEVSADTGDISITGEGTLRFAPDLNFNGPVSISYTISDGELTDTAQVNLTVNPVNDAPILRDDLDDFFGSGVPNRFFLTEDEPRRIDLLQNDFDPDGDDLFIEQADVLSTFIEVDVTINDDGTLTVLSTSETPSLEELQYSVSDGITTSLGFLQLFYTAVNDPPTGVPDRFDATEDTVLEISAVNGVLANDFDPDLGGSGQFGSDFGQLGANLLTEPENGTIDFRSDGSFTYLPDEDFNGSDSFTYKPNDGRNSGESTLVTIDVGPRNDAPVLLKCFIGVLDFDNPFNCVVVGEEDQQSEIPLSQLAFDPDGDPLEITNVQFVNNALTDANPGTLEIADGNRIIFTPTENFSGNAIFTYEITDGEFSVVGQGRILVRGENDAPIANPDTFTVAEDNALIVSTADGTGNLLDNDLDPDSLVLALEVLDRPQHGEFLNDPFFETGSFAYQPFPNFTGEDSFTYRLFDGEDFSQPTTVAILVTPVADATAPAADSYSLLEDEVLVVPAALGVLSNDDNADEAALTATLVTGPQNGFLTLLADGSFSYTPNDDFNGADAFTYATGSSEAEVSLTIVSVNDAPIGAPDVASTPFERSVTIDLITNDIDADGDAIVPIIIEQPENGSLLIDETDGRLTYRPADGFSGVDTFSYTPSDGVALGEATGVTIDVGPQTTDLVFGVLDRISLTENAGVFAGPLLENDLPLAAALGISGLTISSVNAFFETSTPTGEILFPISQPLDTDGTDTFRTALGGTITVTASGVVTYLLPGVESPSDPVAPEIDGLAPTDLLIDSFSYVLSGTRSGGNFPGNQIVTSAPVDVRIEISGVDDAPTSSDASISLDEDQSITGALPPATDPEGDAFVYSVATAPTHGVVEIAENGAFTYTPDPNFSGADSFEFAVTSPSGNGSVHTVDASVAPIADETGIQVSLDANPVPGGDPVGVNISTSLQDNDGSEAVTEIVISALPFGARLSAGETLPDGRIRLDPETDLANLTLTVDDLSVLAQGVNVSANSDQSLAIFDPDNPSGFTSLSSAVGDFNGDGLDDIALSLSSFDVLDIDLPLEILDVVPLREDAGLIAVIYGQEDRREDFDLRQILNNSEGILIVGPQSGSSIASPRAIGDFDGDGFDDLAIVGDNALADPTVIISGAASQGASTVIDLADLQPSEGVALDGFEDFKINAVRALGDVNDDGFTDLSIKSNSLSLGASNNQVLFGSAEALGGLIGLPSPDTGDPLTISIQGRRGELIGDLNGDGRHDLFFGETLGFANPAFVDSLAGRAVHGYVVLATETGFPDIEAFEELDGSNGFAISDPFLGGRSQSRVNMLGDVNNDGFQDLTISVPQSTTGAPLALEKISVVYGSNQGFEADVRLDELNGEDGFIIVNTSSNLFNLANVSDAGDLNGDGIEDLTISSTVLFGSEGVPAVLDLAKPDPDRGFNIFGGAGLNQDQVSIADDIGDFNGDGIDDLILNERNGLNDNLAHIVFGDARTAPVTDFELTVTAVSQDAAVTGNDFRSTSASLTVTVASATPNVAPTANDDVAETAEDAPVTFSPLTNDTDDDGGVLSISSANAENGEVTINDDNTLTYTPDSDFAGNDTIAYTISDGQGGEDTATVQVTVDAVADAPDLAVSVSSDGVLANTSGPDTLVNFETEREQNQPQVTAISGGRFIFNWRTQDHEQEGSGFRPVARIATAQQDGTIEFGDEFIIPGSTGFSRTPQVTELGNGNILFTWRQDTIIAQIMRENGDGSREFGSNFVVPEVQSQSNKLVDVAQLEDGSLFFVWESDIQAGDLQSDGLAGGIAGRTVSIDADGLNLTGQQQFLVNQNVVADQIVPQVTALGGNRALVTFSSRDPAIDDVNNGIAARIATVSEGGAITFADEFRVNASDLSEFDPQVLTLADGRPVLVWSNGDIIGRVGTVNDDGSVTLSDEQTINDRQFGTQQNVQLTQLDDGRVLFTWLDRSEDPETGTRDNIKGRSGTIESDGSITFEDEIFVNQIRESIQTEPQVSALDDGRAAFVWTTRTGPEVPSPDGGPIREISARVIDLAAETAFNIDLAVSTTDQDGSEELETIVISGLPLDFAVAQGEQEIRSNGLDPVDITTFVDGVLLIEPIEGFSGEVNLSIVATALETSNNSTNSSTSNILLDFDDPGSSVVSIVPDDLLL